MAVFRRLFNVFRKPGLRAEIDEELRAHIEARIAGNLALGMSPNEARGDALRRFGSSALAVEEAYDADVFVWLETAIQDIRYAIRSLRSNPGVTVVALLSLALAIGSGAAIFSVVNAVLIRGLPYGNPSRIGVVWVTNTLNGAREAHASIPNFEDWKARARSFDQLAICRESDGSLVVNGESSPAQSAAVHGDFFNLLGRAPALGRVFSGAADNRAVVLSYRFWRSRFNGAPDVVGSTVNLNGVDFEISGVMPEDFAFPSKETELWAPAAALPNWQVTRADRGSGFGTVIARLRPGVTFAEARAEMEVINRQLLAEYPRSNEDQGVSLVPLAAQIHGKTVPFMLAVLSAAILLVLLIACANVANLLLARGAVRRREIAMRIALGAARTRIVRQLLTESILLAVLAGALSLPLAGWGIRALVALAPAGIARLDETRLDGRVLLFSLGLSLATGMLFGLAPAIRNSALTGGRKETADPHARGMRRAFVIAEIALAVVLLTGAGLLIRSFIAIGSVDPGFQTSRELTASLRFPNTLDRDQRARRYRQTIEYLNRLPGVSAAGSINGMFSIGDQPNFGLRAVEGAPAEPRERWSPMSWDTIDGNYFQALGIPLLRGRFFNDRDTKDSTPVVIINQTMARRYWPNEDPIGKGIKGFDPRGHDDEWVRIIGVVRDMRSRGLERSPMALIYESQAQSLDGTEDIVVRTDLSGRDLRDAVRSIDKSAILTNVATLEDRLREQNAPRRFETILVSIFAAIALALAAAGILAMMRYSVAQRTQEIGIRMALGARPADVIGMVIGEAFALTGAGLAMGVAGSFVVTRPIRALLFEVTPADPATIGGVALVLAAIALVACYAPARRATHIDPMTALRCD